MTWRFIFGDLFRRGRLLARRRFRFLLWGPLCGGRGLDGRLRCGRLLGLRWVMLRRVCCWFVACAGGLLVVRRSAGASRRRSARWAVVDRAWSRRRLRKNLDGFLVSHRLGARAETFRRSFAHVRRFLFGIGGSCAVWEFRRGRRAGRIAAWLPELRWLA